MIHAEISYAADYIDLMNNLRLFCSGMMTRTYAGTGNGILKGVGLSTTPVREVWTITCTNITLPALFSVVGSVSGAQANATVGTAYDNGKIKFTIQAGGTNFALNDAFTLTVKQLTSGQVGVETIALSAGGTGYAASGNLIFTGGGYTRVAAGTFTSIAGIIATITLTDGGAGYTSLPVITAATGTGTVITPTLVYPWAVSREGVTGGIGSIAVAAGGTGYVNGNAAIFTGGGYTRIAAGTIAVTSGAITGVTITDPGAGYTSMPVVTAPTGSGATLTPVSDSVTYPSELILRGQGDGGLDNIYVGMKAFTGSNGEGNIFNWKLNGFTGFNSGMSFEQMPGGMATPTAYNLTTVASSTWPTGAQDYPPMLCLDSSATPLQYWLVWEPRSIRLVAKVAGGATYEPMYLGLGKPYATPNQFPYPLVVGGSNMGASSLFRYSASDYTHSGYFDAGGTTTYSPLRYRHIDGTWRALYNHAGLEAITPQNFGTWPWNTFSITALRDNLDGTLPLFPVIAVYGTGLGVGDVLFEMDGVFATAGKYLGASRAYPYTQAGTDQASENTIGSTHVIFPNCNRNNYDRFFALKVA